MSTRLWPYLLLVLGLVLIGCGGGGEPTATPTTTPLPTATPRRYVVSALVGDVILVQPDAYEQIAFRVA